MTARIKKYEHFDEFVENAEPAISGGGMNAQTVLSGAVNRWIRLATIPNETADEYQERLTTNLDTMTKYRSHLLVADSHDSSAGRLVSIATEVPRIGYSWMPVLGEQPVSFGCAKAFSIWLNSTLGRMALRNVTARKISWPKFRPVSFGSIPFPNVDNPQILHSLADCYDETRDVEVPQFKEGRTSIREKWDDAVSHALAIDRGLIGACADKLACDPFVSRERFFEIAQ